MARWTDIETALHVKVYFCDPRSPWQRPTNDQTNGLLKSWLPKGTVLSASAMTCGDAFSAPSRPVLRRRAERPYQAPCR